MVDETISDQTEETATARHAPRSYFGWLIVVGQYAAVWISRRPARPAAVAVEF